MAETQHALLASLSASPSGIGLAELRKAHPSVAPRSLQRWLAAWVATGRVTATGEARARRYSASALRYGRGNVAVSAGPAGRWHVAEPAADDIPLSADARDVLQAVRRPVTQRPVVDHDAGFLARYQPNRSFYLSLGLRRQLRGMGELHPDQTPTGTYGRDLLERLLIDLSWASSHLEGNAYSLSDTARLIEAGQAASGRAAEETRMILNHKQAIEFLLDNRQATGCNRYTLLNLHTLLVDGLLRNPADEGRVRQHAVRIGSSSYQPCPLPAVVEQQFDLLLSKAAAIEDPYEQSFFLLVHLPYLQPFADGNKRTARLAANLPLFRAALCPLTFIGVPPAAFSRGILGVYEMTRVELLRDLYVWAYGRSVQEYQTLLRTLSEPDPLRLAWRAFIRATIRTVVLQPQGDDLALIRAEVEAQVPAALRQDVEGLVIEELRRIHEGVLARYGLTPAALRTWQASRR
ncbi:MAG: hypothetical protein RL026_97 [Pseudomonadota bacterium]